MKISVLSIINEMLFEFMFMILCENLNVIINDKQHTIDIISIVCCHVIRIYIAKLQFQRYILQATYLFELNKLVFVDKS